MITGTGKFPFEDFYDEFNYTSYDQYDVTFDPSITYNSRKDTTNTHVIKDGRLTAADDKTLIIDDRIAQRLMNNIKILCWIPTITNSLETKVKAVNNTWARRCDRTLYVLGDPSSPTSLQGDILTLKVPNGRSHLTAKSVQALKFIHSHFLMSYDWFLKADDDTYIVMENLKFLLSHYSSNAPVYVGHLFKKYSNYGYMSGGAGYVLSRRALRKLVKHGYRSSGKCRNDGNDEDVDIGHCLQAVNVSVHNTVDKFGRESFHPFSGLAHVNGGLPDNIKSYDRNPTRTGVDCCSQLLISFHYASPQFLYFIEQLLYRTSIYGRKIPDTGFKKFFQIGPVPPLKDFK
ncbi:glycoprotein-N-acetylgalactosamine 3-beta-galactosyltransferase 1 isoform X2 [Patella vulgata]|uniref:glycoprotein-N-acetylgalactosamine 3-beta-galactosyltransferase 1 isoform X2 n=1 Tax=Patella vulgata TaxID=6465 RepID=UPI00218029A8|nr:glycoprotein-N-acetylgalactosamine 3-beta-galactosyltransferase 1 isoform X2 [Patella vulgata]